MVPDVELQFKFKVLPALATGEAVLPFTVALDVAVQPFLPVTVTVYTVVVTGLAVGCATVVALKPFAGDQL